MRVPSRIAAACVAGLTLLGAAQVWAGSPERLDGFNIIAVPGHPFGSVSARRSFSEMRQLGANAVAIIPFLWQASPSSPAIDRGSDMPDPVLRTAIREAHAAGLRAVIKPHVWIPKQWAGAVEPATEDGWRSWFAGYRAALDGIVRVAAEEKADAFVIGTELSRTIARPEWSDVIADVRSVYSGAVFYVAHDIAEAEAVPFWDRLDAIGVSLYPPLGDDGDGSGRIAVMGAIAQRLDALAERFHKPVIVAEVGVRSAVGAAAKPWESVEERQAEADPLLQAQVLGNWLAALDRPSVRGVMVWRWFTDPHAGGGRDTDFTVQGKPAEGVLLCRWTVGCARR